MRAASSRNVLAILSSILLLIAPQFASACVAPGSCSISFDQNPITAGQGTYLRWSAQPGGSEPNDCNDNFWAAFLAITTSPVVPWGDNYEIGAELAKSKNAVVHWSGYDTLPYPTKSGSMWVAPGDTTNYYGTLYTGSPAYFYCSATLTVTSSAPAPAPPPPPPPTVLACSISFDKNPIKAGQSASISWSSTKATLFYINGIGYVGGSGSARVSPGSTRDFGGYVSDASGATVSCPAILTVSGSCPPEQIRVNGQCVDQCPPGFTYRDGQCVFVGCPLGYVSQGDKCVFSACPAGYYKDGDRCVRANQCTTPPKCVGNDLVNSCNDDTIATCDWGCASGVCNPVPAPSGVINASPKLLHVGYTSTISWSATNVRACTVTGTNGDAWTGNSSSGKTSKPIQMQTTYYLRCDGYSGSSPASVDKSVIVNIIPIFNEK